MSKTSKIRDIFEGKLIQVWEDGKFTYITFIANGVNLSFSLEDWEIIKAELKKATK